MPERWDYQNDVIMLRFNTQNLVAILEAGESVEIKLSGKWKDGTAFEAYDSIRVIDPGGFPHQKLGVVKDKGQSTSHTIMSWLIVKGPFQPYCNP